MENARRNKGFCNGILYWMLNDCWPAASGWSIIDYFTRPKAAWYSFRRCAKPLIASVDRQNDLLLVYSCNDGTEEKWVQMRVSAISCSSGATRMLADELVFCPAEKSAVVMTIPANQLADDEVLICQMGEEDQAFYRHGKLPIVPVDAPTVLELKDGCIMVRSDRYIHVVRLEGDCEFSDNYFPMLPGEIRTIEYTGKDAVSVTAFSMT